jgi:hypothetical protein
MRSGFVRWFFSSEIRPELSISLKRMDLAEIEREMILAMTGRYSAEDRNPESFPERLEYKIDSLFEGVAPADGAQGLLRRSLQKKLCFLSRTRGRGDEP